MEINELCGYGCGNEAIHIFNNGKKCCSESANKCPSQKAKNTSAQIFKLYWQHGHPDGLNCDYGCGVIAKYRFINGKNCCSESINKCPNKSIANTKVRSAPQRKRFQKHLSDDNNTCDFGCGRIAKYIYKNGKKSCMESLNACPVRRKKHSDALKGIPKVWKNGHPKGALGKTPWCKGKTWEEMYGKQYSDAKKNTQRKRLKGIGIKLTPSQKESQRINLRKKILQRYAAGWEVKCGRCKKIDYESSVAGKIKLDGTWELAVAKFLDSINVVWIRNKKRFEYYNEIKKNKSTYCPDFYIEDWKTYVEVKGYTTELDRCKWKQFKDRLQVWDRKKMKKLNLI